jgi:hypothetical protein
VVPKVQKKTKQWAPEYQSTQPPSRPLQMQSWLTEARLKCCSRCVRIGWRRKGEAAVRMYCRGRCTSLACYGVWEGGMIGVVGLDDGREEINMSRKEEA